MDFKLHDIETITNNFSEDQKIGSGGYGEVYRAMHGGEEIAVKKLHPLQGLDDKQFDNEFRNLTKVSHKNIVRLIGYCYESRHRYMEHKGELVFAKAMERVLCFEYMQRGSLHTHISDESCGLDWPTCYKIIQGTCGGLNHLHTAHENPIFHLDLKPANILLDESMTPKIADLGLSKLVSSTLTHKTEILKGTQGYMPSEYIDNDVISNKFDVFSLGVIIIKVMAGNKGYFRYFDMSPKEFIELVSETWKEKLLQASPGNSSHGIDMLRVSTCIEIALRCVDGNRGKRPCIKDIVHELDELEDEIKRKSLPADLSKDLLVQKRCETTSLAVDPALELRFLFEPSKEVSCCLQITNKTDRFIAFNVNINQNKYHARPTRGTIPPCSKRYLAVTLHAQEVAPSSNMRCHDMLFVQSTGVSEDQASENDVIDYQELFKMAMEEKVVDEVTLPIVHVVLLDE